MEQSPWSWNSWSPMSRHSCKPWTNGCTKLPYHEFRRASKCVAILESHSCAKRRTKLSHWCRNDSVSSWQSTWLPISRSFLSSRWESQLGFAKWTIGSTSSETFKATMIMTCPFALSWSQSTAHIITSQSSRWTKARDDNISPSAAFKI